VLFDLYSENNELNLFRFNKIIKLNLHKVLENKLFSYSNTVFYVDNWIKPIESKFKKYLFKTNFINHPLYVKKRTYGFSNSEDKTILYAGVLYKKNRSPKFFLDLSIEIKNLIKFKVDFYAKGNGIKIINNYSNQSNFINLKGYVDSSELEKQMNIADVLLSIGNLDISQIPSKILEYISTGKPIIHTFKNINDPVNNILKIYPNSFLINENENYSDKLIADLIEFINYSKVIDMKLIDASFEDFTPQKVSEKILNIVEGLDKIT
jgi:hypothetical protein